MVYCRRQRVVVDGDFSNWKSALSGIPQGLILGHIVCFNRYQLFGL